MKNISPYLWKLPLCSLAFFVALAASGVLVPFLGLEAPTMPEGTDPNTVMLWFLLGSLILALALASVSRGIRGGFLSRWLALGLLAWVTNAVSTVLESSIFMTTGAVSSGGSMLFTMLNFLLPSFAIAATVSLLFQPEGSGARFIDNARVFFDRYPALQWAWRVAAAIVAFPAIYISFGLLVRPFIIDYYTQGAYELVAPSWTQIIALQFARSAMFLAVLLPILMMWQRSRHRLAISLGSAVFVLVAFMPVITSYWFPWQMRIFHGLEILADSFVYIGLLVILLAKNKVDRPDGGCVANCFLKCTDKDG